jgi:hypothetical protein
MSLRGIQGQARPAWLKRIVLGDPRPPAYPPLHIKPSAAPTNTAAKGDHYFDSTKNNLSYYDGTNWLYLNGYHYLSVPIAATSVDGHIFIAPRAVVVVSAKEIHSVVGSTSAVVQVRKCTGTTAPASGTAIATANFDLTATVNTTQTATLSATAADYTLAAGDKLALDFGGTLTGLVGVVTIVVRAA